MKIPTLKTLATVYSEIDPHKPNTETLFLIRIIYSLIISKANDINNPYYNHVFFTSLER